MKIEFKTQNLNNISNMLKDIKQEDIKKGEGAICILIKDGTLQVVNKLSVNGSQILRLVNQFADLQKNLLSPMVKETEQKE